MEFEYDSELITQNNMWLNQSQKVKARKILQHTCPVLTNIDDNSPYKTQKGWHALFTWFQVVPQTKL